MTNQAEIRAINTTRSPQPQGAYSQAIVHAGIAYIAGQVPRRPDGTLVNDQPFETQARQALANLETVAHAAGGSLRSALSVTVWLRDLDDKPVFEAVWSEFVHKPYPARAVVHSALNDLSLELSAIIAVERPKEIS